MATIVAPAGARSASIRAVIIRADGRREDLGTVSYWHRNPLKRLAWRVRQTFAHLRPALISETVDGSTQ